jgi:hypothetical protein
MGQAERPTCPHCGAYLTLALPPGGMGKRTFQCFDCEGPDPLKSDKVAGWLRGELAPPMDDPRSRGRREKKHLPSHGRPVERVTVDRSSSREPTGCELERRDDGPLASVASSLLEHRCVAAANRHVRFPPDRWGNRPAILRIAEDFGCCASG